MRKLLLLSSLLWPLASMGQLVNWGKYHPGAYRLVTSPATWQPAALKLVASDKLLVKDAAGTKTTLTPEAVLAFQVGAARYTVEQVEVSDGLWGNVLEPQFVALLDSGQLVLTRHDRFVGNSMHIVTYVVRKPLEQEPLRLVFQSSMGDLTCKDLGELVSPYFATRSDLVQILRSRRAVSAAAFEALVRALNSGNAFQPISTPAFGID